MIRIADVYVNVDMVAGIAIDGSGEEWYVGIVLNSASIFQSKPLTHKQAQSLAGQVARAVSDIKHGRSCKVGTKISNMFTRVVEA